MNIDYETFLYNKQWGEWSTEAEESFNEHIKRLYEWTQGKMSYEPFWITERRKGIFKGSY